MADLITALADLRACRSTWEADAEMEEESQLTAADLDVILAAAEKPDDDGSSGLFNGGDFNIGKLA